MDYNNGVYTYTDSYGNKNEVPIECVSSLDHIQRGDHIHFVGTLLTYYHHAIVETVDKVHGEVNVIEYSNSVKNFIEDNSSAPKNPGLAAVVRGKYNLENHTIYVVKHSRCLDPETVVSRAKSRLGEREYNPVTNNCEHLALWCKTDISSSEQVNNIADALKAGVYSIAAAVNTGGQEIVKTGVYREVTKEVVSHTISRTGDQIVRSGVRTVAKKVLAQTTLKTGQETVKVGISAVTKQVVEQTTVKTGQEVVKTGISSLTKQVVAQTAVKTGQEAVETGIVAVTKQVVAQTAVKTGQEAVETGIVTVTKQVVAQTAVKTGQEAVETGIVAVTKQVVAQTAVKTGQEAVKTGVSEMTKQGVVQTASNSGQEMVKRGIHVATKEVVTQSVSNTGQEVVKTGVRVATKEVVTETVSKTGQEVVKTGTRVTTKEVMTQTSSKVGLESIAGGLALAVAFEGAIAAYDINCAYQDKKKGKITQSDFNKAVDKRIVTGTFNVAGSTAGAAFGQVLIPFPVVGGFIGGIVGSLIGKAIGGLAVS